MKKALLLLCAFFGLSVYSQSIPFPDYLHRFQGTVYNSNFSVGNGITTSTDRFGNTDNAAYLAPGHGEFSLNLPSDNNLKTQGTISFWFKHNSLGNNRINESRPLVFMHNGNTSFYEGIMLANSDLITPNKLRYASYKNQSTGVAGYSSTNYNSSDWVHYAINYKFGTGGYFKIYVNGVLSDNIPMNHTISDLAVHNKLTFLGISNNLGWSSISGYLDDILVYNTNLTDTQINNIYLETYDLSNVSKLLYRFNNDVNDYFGNHNLVTYGNLVFRENNLNQSLKSAAFNIGSGADVYAKVPTNFNTSFSGNNFSVSFGIKPGNIEAMDSEMGYGNGIYRPIVVIPSSNNSLFYTISERLYIGIDYASKKLIVRQNQQVLQSATVLTNSSTTWTYVTVTVDQDNIKLYVNGVLEGTLNLSSALLPISNSKSISIANINDGVNQFYYRGLIDELFFSSETHSASTVSSMYNEYLNYGNTLSSNTVDLTSNKIKVYPNPSKGIVNFNQNVLSATVYDIQGRLILNVTNVDKLDLTSQNNGIYFIQLKSDKGISTHRIIKN